MRCALGGELPPADAVKIATCMINLAARRLGATHLICALDFPGVPTWRKKLYPEYKANRTTDTAPWLEAAGEAWVQRGWRVAAVPGFEADDVIATLAARASVHANAAVLVLSGDSDLLPLLDWNIAVIRLKNGGIIEAASPASVRAKYGVEAPKRLMDFKALAGEAGDNVPGVEGVGPVRARQLLAAYGDLEGVIAAGMKNTCKYSIKVAASAAAARLSLQLVSLRFDVPVEPIAPKTCAFQEASADCVSQTV